MRTKTQAGRTVDRIARTLAAVDKEERERIKDFLRVYLDPKLSTADRRSIEAVGRMMVSPR